jgi:DNA-binding transcriptional MocR family regulator
MISQELLYRRVAQRVEGMIQGGTLRAGDRIPSVRGLSQKFSVSVSTVLGAYGMLENRGLIEARPQSGYYVRPIQSPLPEVAQTESCETSNEVDLMDLVLQVVGDLHFDDRAVAFGAASPSPEFLPTGKLNRFMSGALRAQPYRGASYDSVKGYHALRVQIAKRMLGAGCSLTPEDIITTAGTQQAIVMALQAVTQPGDTVIVETPTYFGLLKALEALHLKALEIGTHPREGICLDELERAIEQEKISACVWVPNFGNPLGHKMPEDKLKRAVHFLNSKKIPLIEDDIYGELGFAEERPKAAKSFDRTGNVILCSSFSKTLAPGYRVGWIVPGKFRKRIEQLKYTSTVATSTPTQMAVASFLENGGFDRHLRRLRRTYQDLVSRMSQAIAENFPEGTRVSRPEGGHVLWVELPPNIDSIAYYKLALKKGVSVAPGPIFSATRRYSNFIRLNCAISWSNKVEKAIRTLGKLAREWK